MTPQERIKADAEAYALPMVWVNQNPKGEEQLFYEYISSTSYITGATAEHEKAKGELKEAQDAAKMFCNKHNETATQLAELVDKAQALVDALEAVYRLKDLWLYTGDVAPEHEGEAQALSEMASQIETALEQWKGKEVGDDA